MALIDRIAAGIDRIGKKTNQLLDESRLRMDLMRQRRKKDNLARDLGYIVYRQSQGATPAEGEVEGLIRRIGDAEKEIERLEKEVETVRRGKSQTQPPPEPPAAESPTT